jgi:integrative and conjugative element protein (TIGR02256 family)
LCGILIVPAMHEKLWIEKAAYSIMQKLADSHFPLETGGMLLGYLGGNGEAVVTNIIGPGPNAVHGRFRFVPDGEYQQAALEKAFWGSEGQETYLGDWHTHPKGNPVPSYFDKRTLAKIAKEPASGIAKPIMAILGYGNPVWNLGVIRFSSTSGFILKTHNVTSPLTVIF